MKKTKRPYGFWKTVPWSLSDQELAWNHGVSTSTVRCARRRYMMGLMKPPTDFSVWNGVRRPRGFWRQVNWEKSNSELASELLADPATVRNARSRYAHHTTNRLKLKPVFKPYRGPKRGRAFWRTVDWSKSTGELVLELGASWSLVSMSRRRYAPETVRFQSAAYGVQV